MPIPAPRRRSTLIRLSWCLNLLARCLWCGCADGRLLDAVQGRDQRLADQLDRADHVLVAHRVGCAGDDELDTAHADLLVHPLDLLKHRVRAAEERRAEDR